jgi:DNA/RNA endonuclease YhcR with UshA esterase domain
MGKLVAVEGAVTEAEWSASGKVLRIKFEGSDKSHFLAIIFQPQREEFDKAYSGDVAKALTHATIHVEGVLTPYKGSPEIVIKAATQLKLIKPSVAGAALKK